MQRAFPIHWLLFLLLFVLPCLACGDDDGDAIADGLPSDSGPGRGDGGGDGDAREARDCTPSGSCLQGPPCGDECCGSGEHCVQGKDGAVCACGEGAACPVGQACEALGPTGEDSCGAVCCGGSDPCPQ